MADVFNRLSDSFGGAFAADSARITFADLGPGLLIQSLDVGYNQQVRQVWEIGSNDTYYVAGRTSGTVTMRRIIGPRAIQVAFYQKYGDVCEAATNQFQISGNAACGATALGRFAIKVKFVVITAIGLSVAAADMVINEAVTMMIASMNIEE